MPLNKADAAKFFELIAEIVNDHGSWQDHKKALLAQADEADKINLEEFIAWFPEAE